MRTPLLVLVTLLAFGSCAQAQFQEPDFLTDRTAWFKAQIECGAKLAHTEAGNQSDEGQRMVVWVAAQRALANRRDFGGGSICRVAYMQTKTKDGRLVSQFSGMHQELDLAFDHPAWVRAQRNTRAVLLGGWKPKEELQPALFYLNPELSEPSRRAWMEKRKKLGVVKDHHFYM